MTVSTFLTLALSEIRVARAGDVITAEDQDLALALFNELLDSLNAQDHAVYAIVSNDFTFTANKSPHTLGPGGDFVLTERPISLNGAMTKLPGTPTVLVPISLRDQQWYEDNRVPGLTQSYPTDVYYSKEWPLGKLYFYPVPTTTYGVRLWTSVVLAQVVATDTFSLPQGYQQALRLTLAELCAPAFGQSVSAETATNARLARAAVWGNNQAVPRIITQDGGMPSAPLGGRFNYRTGQVGSG